MRKGWSALTSIADAAGKEIILMRVDTAHEELLQRGFRGRLILASTIPEALRLLAAGATMRSWHVVLPELALDSIVRSGPPLREDQRRMPQS